MEIKLTLLLLIDFHGHPVLGDDHTNNMRYGHLMELLNNNHQPLCIVSDHLPDRHDKVNEIEKITINEKAHYWNRIDPDKYPSVTIKEIENTLQTKETKIKIHNVIIGGTNLAGCVLRSKTYSAIQWAKAGYHTQIYLPMCADYQLPGVNQVERNLHATSILYNVIREERLFDKIDLVREKSKLIIK